MEIFVEKTFSVIIKNIYCANEIVPCDEFFISITAKKM